MPPQMQKQPSEMEWKANMIGRELKKLQQKCANEAEKKTISIDEIIFIVEFMANQLTTKHAKLFVGHFVAHLKILSEVIECNDTQTDKFVSTLKELSKILCDVIAVKGLPTEFQNHLLVNWLKCLERVPCDSKYRAWQMIKRDLRRNCGRFLVESTQYSMQLQMLDVIGSYLYDANAKGNDLTVRVTKFLTTFKGVIDNVEVAKNHSLIEATVTFLAAQSPSLAIDAKHRVLNVLNSLAKNPSVFSMPISTMKFTLWGDVKQQIETGWMHFNTVFGTLEISWTDNGIRRTERIKPRKLHDIVMMDSADASVSMKFILISVRQRQFRHSKPSRFSKCIEVVMTADCVKSVLIKRLRQVFPAVDYSRFQSDVNNNSDGSSKSSLRHSNTKQNIDANLRRISTISKESTFYGNNDDLGQVSPAPALASNVELVLSNDSSFHPSDCNNFPPKVPSSPQKRPAIVQSKQNAEKSIDSDKVSIYDFVEGDDDEPVFKKPRGRSRRPAQPKKRAKPTPFPRVKSPSVERGERKFTVRVKTPVGSSAKAPNSTNSNGNNKQSHPLANKPTNIKSHQRTVLPSGMKKPGRSVQSQILGRQQPTGKKESAKKTAVKPNDKNNAQDETISSSSNGQRFHDGKATAVDVIDRCIDMGVDNDVHANGADNVQCHCRDEKLMMAIVRIRDTADRAVCIMETCCCSGANTTNE